MSYQAFEWVIMGLEVGIAGCFLYTGWNFTTERSSYYQNVYNKSESLNVYFSINGRTFILCFLDQTILRKRDFGTDIEEWEAHRLVFVSHETATKRFDLETFETQGMGLS